MPTASDLVTDLPADFETFGQAVATSMADLLGGTTGQILSKTSNTDMDFTWITNDVGDITAVTAGTGLSGGGTSGAVSLAIDSTVATLTGTQTLTNKTLTSPALTTPTISTLTTNGDTLYGTGSGAISRLGIGSSGQVLTVAAGVPSWATPSSGSPSYVGVSSYKTASTDQTISNATATAITWTQENFDTDAFHDNTTNNTRFTVPSGKAGKYLISGNIQYYAGSASGVRAAWIYVNGSLVRPQAVEAASPSPYGTNVPMSQILSLSVADYVEIYAFHVNGSSLDIVSGSGGCNVQMTYMGA